MQLAGIATPADIAVEILQVGGLQIAPATLVRRAARDIDRGVAALLAVLEGTNVGVERSARRFKFRAVIAEAVLDCCTFSAPPRTRSGRTPGSVSPRGSSDRPPCRAVQVEIDRVAKRLVEADAVDMRRRALAACLATAMPGSRDSSGWAGRDCPMPESRLTPPTCSFSDRTTSGGGGAAARSGRRPSAHWSRPAPCRGRPRAEQRRGSDDLDWGQFGGWWGGLRRGRLGCGGLGCVVDSGRGLGRGLGDRSAGQQDRHRRNAKSGSATQMPPEDPVRRRSRPP